MANLWEDRERAAEYGFANQEERRFLVARRSVDGLARWAAERIGCEPEAYADVLVGEFLSGAASNVLVRRVEADLVRAGEQPRPGEVAAVLHKAAGDADITSAGGGRGASQTPSDVKAVHARHAFWGWDV